MSLNNRAERVPSWLFGVDIILCAGFIPLAFIAGTPVLFFAPAFVLLMYAFGGFDVLSLSRHQSAAAPLKALSLVVLAYTLFILLGPGRRASLAQNYPIFALVVGSFVGLAVAHTLLRGFFVTDMQQVELMFPSQMAALAKTVEHFAQISGYPAKVRIGGSDSELTAVFDRARVSAGDSFVVVETTFDPVRFFDLALRVLPPDFVASENGFLTSQMSVNRFYVMAKRLVDMVLSLVMLVVTAPLWFIAAAGILISDGRPVFFSQPRVGKNGRKIRVVKFRTLASARDNTPDALHDIDGRVFPFGRFLRRSRIDELPQLIMILVGTISFVGPRPETKYFHERSMASIPCYAERLRATPGLTGWAQIRYTHTTTEDEYRDKTAYDLWYVLRRGMMLDTKIMVRTAGTLLNRFGSR